MLPKISLLALFGLSFALGFAQPTIQVTPQALAGWSFTGTDQPSMAARSTLTLPPSAQLARTFATAALTLRVSTRPAIGLTATDWPVLEIGAAALVFLRDGETGKLALVLGTHSPVELPGSYALDVDGRSVDPLTVTFAREGAVGKVEAVGQKLSFPADPAGGPGLEVVASAGAGHDWSFDRLEVALPAGATVVPGAAERPFAGSRSGAAAGAPERERAGAETNPRISRFESDAEPDPAGAPGVAASAPAPAGAGTLEIFTPPAIRHGRADAVRKTVATGLQK
ncbi:MAG: hypothetical protein HY302_02855 [Opitutae bacterium]|nr:hypothetical protein [Opitutae bacterium]